MIFDAMTLQLRKVVDQHMIDRYERATTVVVDDGWLETLLRHWPSHIPAPRPGERVRVFDVDLVPRSCVAVLEQPRVRLRSEVDDHLAEDDPATQQP